MGLEKKERGLEQVEPPDYPSLRSTFSRARRNYYFASPKQLRAWNRLVFLWVSCSALSWFLFHTHSAHWRGHMSFADAISEKRGLSKMVTKGTFV